MEKSKDPINLAVKDFCKIKVSSVLGNSSKEFGGHFIIDQNPDTCWSSNQGSTQSIVVEFKEKVTSLNKIEFLFQGGFGAKEITVYYFNEDLSKVKTATPIVLKEFTNLDNSDKQVLVINENENDGLNLEIYGLKITMLSFYDLFGRTTVYNLKILS